MFKKAEKAKSKMRIALQGPSGSGKTYGALSLASGLGNKIAVIDTERGSASLYSDLFNFDVMELSAPYTPEAYINAIEAAESAGYDVLIIDSITHEWNGKGGILELVDIVAQKFRGNTWSAWSELTPRHRAFIDKILQSKMHIVVTMRTKVETAQVDKNGKKVIEKLGTKSEQKDDIEYEFTTVFDLMHGTNIAIKSKDRTSIFNSDPFLITQKTGESIKEWCDNGIIKNNDASESNYSLQKTQQKQEIVMGSDVYTRAIEALKAGKTTIEAVKNKCIFNDEVKQAFLEAINTSKQGATNA